MGHGWLEVRFVMVADILVIKMTSSFCCTVLLMWSGHGPCASIHHTSHRLINWQFWHVVVQVSYGPTIKGAHSPDERCLVPTVTPFWDLTLKVLDKLADRRP